MSRFCSITIGSTVQFLRFQGVFPYRLEGNRRVSHFSVPLLVWSVFVNGGSIYFVLINVDLQDVIEGDQNGSLHYLLLACLVFALSVNIYRMGWHKDKFDEILFELETVYGLHLPSLTLKLVWRELTAILVTSIAIIVGYGFESSEGLTYLDQYFWEDWVAAIVYIVILNGLVTQFVCFLAVYEHNFELVTWALSESLGTRRGVDKLIDRWNRVFESCRRFEIYYGDQILSLFATNVATIVLSMFLGLSKDLEGALQTCPWMLNSASQVFVMAHSPTRLSRKAAEFTRLLTIKAEHTAHLLINKKVELHIRTNEKLEFTAGGYFRLDLGLLTNIIGMCVSYWVILGQLPSESQNYS